MLAIATSMAANMHSLMHNIPSRFLPTVFETTMPVERRLFLLFVRVAARCNTFAVATTDRVEMAQQCCWYF